MIDNGDQGLNKYIVSTDKYIAEEKENKKEKTPITAEEWKKRCARIRINGLAMG